MMHARKPYNAAYILIRCRSRRPAIIYNGDDGVMEAHLNQEEMASVQPRLVPNPFRLQGAL